MSKDIVFDHICTFIAEHQLIKTNQTIVVGLSGGPDSVFLLHVLSSLQKEYNLHLIAVHLNHEWRADAEHDVQFCQKLAESYDIQFIGKKISELALPFQQEGSQEEFGRRARRFFFEQIAQEYKANAIALAHHANDQQETFFIRLLRGSGLTGLTSMRPKHGLYIRPLLPVYKQEILAYLDKNNISYLTDPTNISQSYLRNRIRMNVIPALQQADERFDVNFAKTIERLQETESYLEELTVHYFEQVSIHKNNYYEVDVKKFLSLHKIMQYRVLLYWFISEQVPFSVSQSFMNEVIRFIKGADGGEHQVHTFWKIVKKSGFMFIAQTK